MDDNDFLIDSNILVYAFDTSEGKKHQQAKTILNKCWDGFVSFSISLQNLHEFYFVLTTKKKHVVSPDLTGLFVKHFIEFYGWKKLIPSPKSIIKAIEIVHHYKLPFWDAHLVAVMLENNIHHIYTEDVADFKKFPNIVAINPFES